MIQFNNVSKTFDNGKNFTVSNLSLTIHQGELLAILGKSGCGKSTTLKMINRLIEPSQGTIEIFGRPIDEYDTIWLRRSIGYVFQDIGLFPHMTVEENVAIVLRLVGTPYKQRTEYARELLQLVNLDPQQYATCLINQLSGGQQQRVGVARALATNPSILLMDEPFASLDAITRSNLQEEIIRLHKTLKKTIVFVTHDIREALRLADRIAIMDQGKLLQIGLKHQLLSDPINEFVDKLFEGYK